MWSNGKGHEDRPGQRILYSQSIDGKSWQPPKVLADHGDETSVCVASGFHVVGDAEKLVAYYTVPQYPTHNLMHQDTALFALTSTDGLSWSKPQRVTSGFFIQGPLLLSNGRLVMAGDQVGAAWKTHQERMRLIYSDDPGGIIGWKTATISLVWNESLWVVYSANKEDIALTRISLNSLK